MALTAPQAAAWPVPKHLCSCLSHPLASSTAPCTELLCPHCGTQAWEGDPAGRDGERQGDAYPNKHGIYEMNASACLEECRETPMHPRRCSCFSKAGRASLRKPTCSTLAQLLQQGSSSPCLPLQTSATSPLCVGAVRGSGRLSGWGQDSTGFFTHQNQQVLS